MRRSVIISFFYRLSSALEPYGKIVLAVALLLICVTGYRFSQQQLDLSAASLIPDSSPELVRISNFLDINPSSRVTLVEFRSESPDDAEIMQGMAAELELALAGYMEESRSRGLPRPGKMVAMLPYLFDEEARELIAAKSEPEAVAASVKGVREAMLGLYGFAPKEFMRADPLGWLTLIGQKASAELFRGSSFNPANLHSYPVSEDGRHVLLILRPKADLYDVQKARDIMVIIESKLAELFAPLDGRIQATVVGGPRFTAENAVTIERDLKVTLGLAMACLAVIYLFTVRSLASIWLLLTPVVAVIFAGSALTLFWPSTAGLALAFGAAVLGIAVDFAVLAHFALRRNLGEVSRPVVIASISRPMVFSAGLCIASFAVLLFSGLPALRQLGFFAAASLAAGLLIATLILPYCPWIDKPRIKPLERGAEEVELKPRALPLLLVLALLLGVCAWGFNRIPFDSSVQRMGANTENIQAEIAELRSHWQSGAEPLFWLNSGASQDQALARSARLVKSLRSEGAVAFSLADLLPPAQIQRENLARWSEFVQEQGPVIQRNLAEAAAANGFKPAAFRGFDDWLEGQRQDALAGRIVFSPSALKALIEEAGLGDMFWWMSSQRDGEEYVFTYSDRPVDLEKLPPEIRENTLLFSISDLTEGIVGAFDREIRILPLAGLVCLALLVLCFRSPLLVALACLPPLFGLSSVLIWQYLSGNDLTLAGVAALTLVIGLGADYGIVMLHELSSRRSFGAFRSILVSGLTTLSGLGVLILAKHPVLRELGGITFFGLSAEMLAVLLIVPLLCRRRSHAR